MLNLKENIVRMNVEMSEEKIEFNKILVENIEEIKEFVPSAKIKIIIGDYNEISVDHPVLKEHVIFSRGCVEQMLFMEGSFSEKTTNCLRGTMLEFIVNQTR